MYWLIGRRSRTGRSSPVFLVSVERREGKPSELGWTSSTVLLASRDRITLSVVEASCISAVVDPGCGDLAWTGDGVASV